MDAANESRVADPPLAGLTVIDLTQLVSGAVATLLMADFGADVIKIEPLGGEPYRRSGYPISYPGGETNLNILRFSRGKRSVALNLALPEGKEALRRLLSDADVIVENFRPGVLTRLGFSPAALREEFPRLVYTSVSGFGHDDLFETPGGVESSIPAFAITIEAMSGLTALTGADAAGRPVWMGFAMADIFSGMVAFAGTLLALRQREDRRRVDISMFDCGVFMNDLALAYYGATGDVMDVGGHALQAPWGPYPAKDGYIVIAILTERQWEVICRVIEAPELAEDPGLRSGLARSRDRNGRVDAAITKWTSTRSRKHAVEALLQAGVPAAPVNTAREVAENPLVHTRQMLVPLDGAVMPGMRVVGNPVKIRGHSDHALRIARLGEHTAAVLEAHGYSRAEIDGLVRDGVAGVGDER